MKGLIAGISAALVTVLIVVLTVVSSTASAATGACLPESVGVVGTVPSTANLDAEQQANARTIVETVVQRRLPSRAAVIAIATAMQESGLRMLTSGDRDSVNMFQQRPSQGWGTLAQLMDPVYATNAFLDHLQDVDNWPVLPLGQAA